MGVRQHPTAVTWLPGYYNLTALVDAAVDW